MPRLVLPRLDLAAGARAAGRGADPDSHPEYGDALRDLSDDQLGAWVERLLIDTREGGPRSPLFVPSTHLWWAEGSEYLGRVQIRHRLTPFLRQEGGHIGYHVVPGHRRRGHATAMLAAALPVAAAVGIECALLSCDATNDASRRVIEANGGLAAGQRGDLLRFWVPTG